MLITGYPLFICSLIAVTLSDTGHKLKDCSLKSLHETRLFLKVSLCIISLILYISGVTSPAIMFGQIMLFDNKLLLFSRTPFSQQSFQCSLC